MPSAPPLPQRPRGRENELHRTVGCGSIEGTISLLSSGSIDIDQGDPKGVTPLMISAAHGHSRVVRILLEKGANVSLVDDSGYAALHPLKEETSSLPRC